MTDDIEVYTFTDQPATCPKCGARTAIIHEDFESPLHTQHHRCLSANCCFEFVMQMDDDDFEIAL
jgi:hypothetical protein